MNAYLLSSDWSPTSSLIKWWLRVRNCGRSYIISFTEEYKSAVKTIKLCFDCDNSVVPHTIFKPSQSFTGFYNSCIYFRKESVPKENAATVYKRLNHIQFYTLDEDVGLAWRWSKISVFFKLFPKAKEVQYILHVFFGVNNKICLVSIEELWKVFDFTLKRILYLWFGSECRCQYHSLRKLSRKLQRNISKKQLEQECHLNIYRWKLVLKVDRSS